MRKHKTMLISCFIQDSPQAMPLAAGLLKSSASDIPGLEIQIMNFNLDTAVDDAVEQISEQNPHSVGCSVYIWNKSFFYHLIKKLKEKKPHILFYAGGAEVTASADLFDDDDLFDYLIPGEGEIPFINLMEAFLQEKKLEQKILKKQHFSDINTITSPYLSGILTPPSYEGILWELSRGCPFNCSFCCESRGVRGVRYYSENRIIDELNLFESSGVQQIWVLDPTFNINKERALKILSLIESISPDIHFMFEIRAELLDEATAEAFSRIHCSLQIGLQSRHREVLEKINRTINEDLFSEKISLLNQSGVVFGLDLIYGLPGDTYEGFMSSIDYAVQLIPNHLDIFRLSVFPGTELYDNAEDLKLVFSGNPPYEVISSETFSEIELLKAEQLAESTDLFYNKGKAAPWLLPLIEYLKVRPSHFFRDFNNYIKDSKVTDENIMDYQTGFLLTKLSSDSEDDITALTLDLILFHHLYSKALFAALPQKEHVISDLIFDRIIEKSTVLQMGIFSYDVTLYYDLGMFDLEWFTVEYEREVSYGMIFNINGFIQVMALDKSLYQFLQAVDGKRSINEILEIINGKAEEMSDFIGFLWENDLLTVL